MVEYISRQAAIDGKISIQRANGVEIYTDEAVPVEHLKNVPAVDVVPVVRCWKCKYVTKWRSEESARKFGQVYECRREVLTCPDPNDFCCRGERKE